MMIVDIRHWLSDEGDLPVENLRLRRQALRVARFIEYGATLRPRQSRETLVECTRRPGGRPCAGLLWVEKTQDDRIHVFCPRCRRDEALIDGWRDTLWSDGMMEPLPDPDGVTTPAPGGQSN